MEQINKYKNATFSEEELDAITGKIIRAKFRKERKNKWTQQLEKDYGIIREKSNSTSLRRKNYSKYFITIAASLLFLAIAFIAVRSNFTSTAERYVDSYLQENKFPNSTATKGILDIPLLELKMAEAYNKGSYSEAIKLGEQLIELDATRSTNYFFLGLSYLYNDDLQNAKKALLQFREINAVQFDQESRWFLALTYTKLKSFENAKLELQYIISHKEWNFKKAEELLERLQ